MHNAAHMPTPSRATSYGPAPSNADSAVNVLLDVVRDQSGKSYKMDHFQTRYPTNVLDVAGFLTRLAGAPPVLLQSMNPR
jgi:S-adenosylmethionine synthetase